MTTENFLNWLLTDLLAQYEEFCKEPEPEKTVKVKCPECGLEDTLWFELPTSYSYQVIELDGNNVFADETTKYESGDDGAESIVRCTECDYYDEAHHGYNVGEEEDQQIDWRLICHKCDHNFPLNTPELPYDPCCKQQQVHVHLIDRPCEYCSNTKREEDEKCTTFTYRERILAAYEGVNLWRAAVEFKTGEPPQLMTAHVFESSDEAISYAAGWLDHRLGTNVGLGSTIEPYIKGE